MDLKGSLSYFYIFCTSQDQSTIQKNTEIVFFHPCETDNATQTKMVGLSEAMVKFSRTFSSNGDCKCLFTGNTIQVYYQPRKNYWMIMTLNVPSMRQKDSCDAMYHYYMDSINSEIYLSALKQAYKLYFSFLPYYSNRLDELEQTSASQFFSEYLKNTNIAKVNMDDLFFGVQFLPLDRKLYLHVQCLVNQFCCTFDQIDHTMYFVNNQIAWSSLDSNDTKFLYRYILHLQEFMVQERDLPSSSLAHLVASTDNQFGRFVTVNSSNGNSEKIFKLQLVNDKHEVTVYHLLIYSILSSSFCMLIKDISQLSQEDLESIEAFMHNNMSSVASELSLYIKKRSAVKCNVPFFIYYNQQNTAQKSYVDTGGREIPVVEQSILTSICRDESKTCETVIKTHDGYWIFGYRCNARMFYAIIDQKHSTLTEIDDEIKQLQAKQLKTIFFIT